MASIRRDQAVFSSMADAPTGTRLVYNTLTAVVGSLGASVMAITLREPPAGQARAAFRNIAMELVPMGAGLAATYTLVSGIARDARNKDDWVNPFLGGGVSGLLIGALRRRSVAPAIGAAVVFGAAAASPYWYAAMSPTLEELQEKNKSAPSAVTGATYAQAASQPLTKRLL